MCLRFPPYPPSPRQAPASLRSCDVETFAQLQKRNHVVQDDFLSVHRIVYVLLILYSRYQCEIIHCRLL